MSFEIDLEHINKEIERILKDVNSDNFLITTTGQARPFHTNCKVKTIKFIWIFIDCTGITSDEPEVSMLVEDEKGVEIEYE